MTDQPRNGWGRYHALKKQDQVDRDSIIAGLLRDLGREATMSDRLDIETIANLHMQARRFERQGKFAQALEVRNAIIRAQRTTGIKSKPAAPAPKKSIKDHLRERGYPVSEATS